MTTVTSLKYSADSSFKIESPGTNKYVTIQDGAIKIQASAAGDSAALWQYSLDTGAVKNVATGLYIGKDGSGFTASSSPHSWTILDNGDGTYSFQATGSAHLATYSSGADALSLSANKSGGHTWKIVMA
ncbi:hypothetical protein Clacol_004801 [Clathrus columnatus]|uniref:Uncharacterized protein n=1 Tax=Clathrus columnatus TaxID=1419009 RepID=A0AAV5A7H9_9AGAM|nr:hypothetical protein Clacol_004801 [Clathrus columnatus]